MSANLIVDLGQTTLMGTSITDNPVLSGSLVAPASGTVIGVGVDLMHANTFCNLFAAGVSASGQVRLQVQCADSDVSGSYTDPTSGLAQLPTVFASGGIVWVNSGGTGGGVFQSFQSGQQAIASGWAAAAGFQRTGRYARVNVLSEGSAQYGGGLIAGFISQLRTTGSGGGFTFSPGSGTVNV